VKLLLKRLLFYLAILLLFFLAYMAYLYDDAISVSKGVPIAQYENPTTALLVIDVQEGTTGEVSTDEHYTAQSSALIKKVNEAISVTHEAGYPVIYIQQETRNRILNWFDGYLLAEGYPGVAIDSRLKMVSINQFPKRIMDAFSNPVFDRFLQDMQVNRLIITGLDIAFCAGKTSQAALNRGYEVIIVEEAVISESDQLKNESLKMLQSKGAKVIPMQDLPTLFME
jgi:nicotinamidase-related amidase